MLIRRRPDPPDHDEGSGGSGTGPLPLQAGAFWDVGGQLRVAAVNAYGVGLFSDPSMLSRRCTTKLVCQPTWLSRVVLPRFVALSWDHPLPRPPAPPFYDPAIDGWRLEQRALGGEWTQLVDLPEATRNHVVANLKVGLVTRSGCRLCRQA